MIRLLIVDDSAVVRKVLSDLFATDPGIEVVGTAPDPLIARKKIKMLNPDVLTLDIEMPRMDGLTFLENLMRLRPMPVVMVSTHTTAGAAATVRALELGAVDFAPKPSRNLSGLDGQELIAKVKRAASVRSESLKALAYRQSEPKAPPVSANFAPDMVVGMAASTGGPEAFRQVLTRLPKNFPPTVLVQHLPDSFYPAFADRLDRVCAMRVQLAEHGAILRHGIVYVGPPGYHTTIGGLSAPRISLQPAQSGDPHVPSADPLFRSMAQLAGKAVGVVLTGMGSDGAQGLTELHSHGGTTLAQDESTSVVWGMPGSAVRAGAVTQQLRLDEITHKLVSLLSL